MNRQGRSGRPVYGRKELGRLLEPQSIAIVGISANVGSFGQRTLVNLAHYRGRIYGVNPKYDEVHGLKCYPSLAALPEVPDCVALAVPREAVEPLVEQCAAIGAGGVIIFASGYAETGLAERERQQERLGAIAAASDLRIIGPNCIGMINNLSRAGVIFQPNYDKTPYLPGMVGLISQSGALGYTMVQACERGVGFSHYFTGGNCADVDVCDFISYLVEVPETRAIACLLEGIRDGERLLQAGEKALAADKPVVLYKMTTGAAAAAAAMSHTGSLAGSDAAYRAAFARTGIVAVDNLEAVFETASFLAKAGRPEAAGVAVVATSGGAAVIAADKAERHGVPMPQPGRDALAVLTANIPDYGSPRNPCDITAQVLTNPDSFGACLSAMLTDPVYGTMVLPQVAVVPEITPKRIPVTAGLARQAGKPICMVWMTEWLQGPGSDLIEADPNLALFRSMDRCFAAIAAWQARELRRQAPRAPAPRRSSADALARSSALLATAGPKLTEREAKQILAAYGVPVTGERLVTDPAAAVAAAGELGFPVALKVESPDIAHKTEAGVIRLNLPDAAAVRAGFAAVMAAAAKVRPQPQVRGVLVQPMIPAGVELVVGAKLDPQFGPLVVVGLGGILVELLRDTAVGLAPVDLAEAKAMLGRLKGQALLTGFRGSAAVDLDRVAEIICRVSEFAADHADRIAEVDVNPVICSGDRAIAVDALIVRAGSG